MGALGQRMDGAEQRLEMEAGLGASRDRDIADIKLQLRAHGRSLQAVADTLSDHGRRLMRLETGQDALRGEMRAGFQAIAGQLDRLIDDTRPRHQDP